MCPLDSPMDRVVDLVVVLKMNALKDTAYLFSLSLFLSPSESLPPCMSKYGLSILALVLLFREFNLFFFECVPGSVLVLSLTFFQIVLSPVLSVGIVLFLGQDRA